MALAPAFVARICDPPKVYRPIPFWSWNEDLNVAETRRQIAEMDRVGIGGYFMHARGGLQTSYMGADWVANIEAGIDEARQRGMGAWAYDENGWPSGFGDGRINGRGVAFQQKYLRYAEVETEVEREDGRGITHVRLSDRRLFQFYFDVNPYYVDTLDPSVTKAFLDEIYLPYAEAFPGDFGKAMPGFFTDEPQISRNGIPWSLTLPERYRDAYGEDLLPLLPELFLSIGTFKRTRYRFWHLVQELFVTGFTQQIHDWCEARGAQLTGHMVLEESLLSQLTSNGAVMPHYEFFHIPGMDWLGRHIDPPTTPIQVASVAHQTGRRQILSETFALTGWNVSFEELKWMFDWQMVRGVTQLCQHLEGYSLRGIRKRDYPPSLFFQQPWWDEQYRLFNDAVSRVGMLLSDGDVRADVLVIHPQASGWLHFDCGNNGDVQELFSDFIQVTRCLEGGHVQFHYGDERVLRRHGSVTEGLLSVGTQSYRAVVVPSVDTLAASTVELLAAYVEAGGTLIWCGRLPTSIEGEPSERLAGLVGAGRQVASADGLLEALPAAVKRVSVTDRESSERLTGVAATCRHFAADQAGVPCRFWFFANADATHDHDARIVLSGRSAVRLVQEDGSLVALPCEFTDDEVAFDCRIERGGSVAVFVADERDAFGSAELAESGLEPLSASCLAGEWECELVDPNALTLDVCDVLFDGELIAEGEHISVVQKRALDLEREVDVELRFRVGVAEDFDFEQTLYLVLECPDRFAVSVNDRAVDMVDCGGYRDTSFRKVDIRGMLSAGDNEIRLVTRFTQSAEVYENLRRAAVFEAEKNKLTYDSEIEAVYLIGAFGLRTPGRFTPLPRQAMRYAGSFELGRLPTAMPLGDLTTHGLPFFNGRVRLRKRVVLSRAEVQRRCFLFAERMAAVVGLIVNGKRVCDVYWRPYEVDLTGVLQEGENVIEIELTSGLRNLLGPHHLKEGESYAVGPRSFFKEPNIWGACPWNDDYCFVEFGIRL